MRTQNAGSQNPFDVMDVPNPNDREVLEFAVGAKLAGTSDDENAKAWTTPGDRNQYGTIEGNWSSRWNGGADPTMPGDAASKWKQGQAEVKTAGDRVYLLFAWDNGVRRGLIDARREGKTGLVGKYINLTDTKITRPLDRFDRERPKNRWTVDRRASGFPSLAKRDDKWCVGSVAKSCDRRAACIDRS